jgi:hypothetical protein
VGWTRDAERQSSAITKKHAGVLEMIIQTLVNPHPGEQPNSGLPEFGKHFLNLPKSETSDFGCSPTLPARGRDDPS